MKKELLSQIKKHNRIIIQRHQKPDGDALGSQFGLREIIKLRFPEKEVLVVGSLSEFQDNSIRNIFKEEFDEVKPEDYNGSLAIIVDTANVDRIEGEEFFRAKTTFKVDHHASGEHFGKFEWVEGKTSSACEMITRWARENKLIISELGAKYLLTGMVTDTGRFMFNSVTSYTFQEAMHLMASGAKIHKIANALNDRNINFIRLQGYILSNLQLKNGVSFFMLPKGMEKKFGVDYNTASSMVFLLMSYVEAEYAVYLSYDAKNKIWKGSLRSKKKPINHIAEKYDGGGHEMASGFKLKDPKLFNTVVEELMKLKTEKKNNE